jgi:hypothetical protein
MNSAFRITIDLCAGEAADCWQLARSAASPDAARKLRELAVIWETIAADIEDYPKLATVRI